MTIVVTGAAGGLGGAAVTALLARGTAPESLIATTRDAGRLRALRDSGVTVRQADYDDPRSMREAFDGADRLLLVSSNSRGDRVVQHRAAIEAAAAVGVGFVVYTSLLHADTSPSPIIPSHRETERVLRESGLPHAILRNGQFLENYLAQLPFVRPARELHGSAGDGLISGALRAEYGEAAAVVVAGDGSADLTFELGGDEAFTLSTFAKEVAARFGEPFSYIDHPADELPQVFATLGLPAFFAPVAAETGNQARRGELFTDSGDLRRLLGRPTTRLREALAGID